MDLIKKVLPLLGKILTWITLSRVLLLALFSAALIISITLFEQRSYLIEIQPEVKTPIPNIRQIELNEELKKALKSFVDKSSLVVFVSVVNTNISVNQRETFFFYTDSIVGNLLYEQVVKDHGRSYLLFTVSELENKQIVDLMNNKFACHPYSETLNMKLAPKGEAITPVICRVALPPFYGSFKGYLTIGISRKISDVEHETIKFESIKLANIIYSKND